MKTDQPLDGQGHFDRRDFLLACASMGAAATLGSFTQTAWAAAHALPPLPFADSALEPVISANTLSFHYGKHHKAYVDNLNKLIAGTEWADMTLDRIVAATAGKADKTAVFNNSAQAWNHSFYWHSLRAKGGGEPPAALH